MTKTGVLRSCIKKHLILLLTAAAVIIGIAVGVIINIFNAADVVKLYIALPGELFLRALYFSVLPLLACNIVAMSSKLKPSTHGWIALMALIYCICLNNIGGFLGAGVTTVINPGERFNMSMSGGIESNFGDKRMELSDVLPDFLRNMVPDNIIKTLLFSTVTTHIRTDSTGLVDKNNTEVVYRREVGVSSGPNILGILVSSLVLGLIAGSRQEKTQPFIALAEAVTEVMTILTEKIILLLPLAMISLIASALATVENLKDGIVALGLFVACSLCFNVILALIVLPLTYIVFTRRNLFAAYRAMYRPLITAFSATSSLIALPDLFKVCDQMGVEPYTVRTVAPFLTSLNANGSSAFVASAVCFAAQVAGFPLHALQIIGIGLLSGFNVMALPAVPSASIITVFLIIRVFGIPEQAVSLLFIVEFINDRMRTVTNVMSHVTCILLLHWKFMQKQKGSVDPIAYQSSCSVAGDTKDTASSDTLSKSNSPEGDNNPNPVLVF